jgi:hypothetical protein
MYRNPESSTNPAESSTHPAQIQHNPTLILLILEKVKYLINRKN